jgi:DNA polymerase III sliding clamp (beta) subunit (PCNA family)
MTQKIIPTVTTVGQLKAALKRVTTATGAKSAIFIVDSDGLRVEAATAGGYASVKVPNTGPIGNSCEAEIDASLVNVLLTGEEHDTALTVTSDDRGARIRYARASLLLKKPTTYIEGLFPNRHRKMTRSTIVTLTGQELSLAAESATTFMATKDVRYYLCGVHLMSRDGKLVLEATDGFAMHANITNHALDNDLNVIIPHNCAEAMISVFEPDEVITIEKLGTTLLGFKTEKMYWVSNLIEGRFPECERLFVDETLSSKEGIEVILSRKSLAAAINRVASVSGKEGHYLKMQFMAENVVISSLDDEQKDLVPVHSIKGSAVGLALHCSFSSAVLGNSLDGVPSEFVMFRKGQSVDSKIFIRQASREGDTWNSSPNWKAVVMPSRA